MRGVFKSFVSRSRVVWRVDAGAARGRVRRAIVHFSWRRRLARGVAGEESRRRLPRRDAKTTRTTARAMRE
jgi:hypothetical protein